MRIGITAYNMTGPELVALGRTADHLGFQSLWLGEHILLPSQYASGHPTDVETGQPELAHPIIDLDTELVDPLVALAAVASATESIELATGIYLLPLRHPLMTARAAVTLQELCGGRFWLGVGTGWLKEEFAALGVPFAERVKRFDEAVDLVRRAGAGGTVNHQGPWYPTHGPVQLRGRACPVPIVYGGNTELALKRAASVADGWFASGTPTLEEFLRMRDRLETLRAERPGPFRYWVRVNTWDPDVIDLYRSEGVDEVLLWARSPYVDTYRNELWPLGAHADQEAGLAEIANALDLIPGPEPPRLDG